MKYLAGFVLSIWVGLTGALTANAQSVTTLYSFDATNGANPFGALALGPDGNFYGPAKLGGNANYGTLYRVTIDGALTTLVNFDYYTNGAYPVAGLTLGPDRNFYGTTLSAGDGFGGGEGTVFQLTTNGTLTTLVSFFFNTNGANPTGRLILGPDGNYYGTCTAAGAISSYGTVFRVSTNGALEGLAMFLNSNGADPEVGLALGPDGNFYGATAAGGTGNYGTIFKITTNGTLTTLLNFNKTNGATPRAGLTLAPDGSFYGTTYAGGTNNNGTVFKITTNGTLTTLINFNNTNGANPYDNLTLGPDGSFYGTTAEGGISNNGTVFNMTTDGTLTTLVKFNGANGSLPRTGLTLGSDGNFYGTTFGGGSWGDGTIFRLELRPGLFIGPSNQTVVIEGSATFNCQPSGKTPFAYQWLSNGLPIASATNSSFTVPTVSLEMAADAQFQVVVTNVYGSVTSQPVSLNVVLQPNIYAISNAGTGNFNVSLASLPNSTNRLWVSTNLKQWHVIATNVMDGNGLAQYEDSNTAGVPQNFYRLSYP